MKKIKKEPALHSVGVNSTIRFEGEKLPYTVKAFDGRYAICTRKLHRREDAGLLKQKVETGAYCTFTEAYNDCKDSVVYTICDFERGVRSTHDYVFSPFDYSVQEDIDNSLQALQKGEYELSKRNMAQMRIAD